MILWLTILGTLSILSFIYNVSTSESLSPIVLWLTTMLFGILLAFYIIDSDKTPTAMDVYQGKTTLEITYKDSIAVDSVVVFKDERIY